MVVFVKTENAEKYSELLCESRFKAEELNQLERMLENPDTIEVVNFAFADSNSSAEAKCCYGPRIEVYDKLERVECVKFFIQFIGKQLEDINNQISSLQIIQLGHKEETHE